MLDGSPNNRVSGVVIGTRKAGSTWLYENFRNDPAVRVSNVVKESRYFLGAMTDEQFHAMFPRGDQPSIEVDTALCYEDRAARHLRNYGNALRLLLILRDPVDFAVSRFIHGTRKGELRTFSISEALLQHGIFQSELDYSGILERYSGFGRRLKVVTFDSLRTDPTSFYWSARAHLADVTTNSYRPFLDEVNKGRSSRLPYVSTLLARSAKLARSLSLHLLVNSAKRTRLHTFLERPSTNAEAEKLRQEARPIIRAHYADALRVYEKFLT